MGTSAFGLLSFVTLLLFLSFAESFFLGLPTTTVVVAVTVVMDQAQAIAMCAVRMAPVDESVSVQILHEADASSCRGRKSPSTEPNVLTRNVLLQKHTVILIAFSTNFCLKYV